MSDALQGTPQKSLGTNYTLERKLAVGGMSREFIAAQTGLARPAVIKLLAPDLGGGVNVDRLKREIQLAAPLQYAHVVPVTAVAEIRVRIARLARAEARGR